MIDFNKIKLTTIKFQKTLNTFRTRQNFMCAKENHVNALRAPKKNGLNFPETDF